MTKINVSYKTRNHPKPPNITQNQPKPAKATHNQPKPGGGDGIEPPIKFSKRVTI